VPTSLALATVGSALMATIAAAVFGWSLKKPTNLGLLAFGQIGLWGGLLGGPIMGARQVGARFREFVRLRIRPIDLLWAALGPVLQVVIGLAYLPFVSTEEVSKPAKDLAAQAQGQLVPYLLLAVAVVVGAPIVEETFFRGFFLGVLSRSQTSWVRQPVVAIALTSTVFGLFHFQPLLTPALIFFGAICGVLAYRFGRIGPSICLHIGFNAHTMIQLGWQVFH
jgi:uncharacterized protein